MTRVSKSSKKKPTKKKTVKAAKTVTATTSTTDRPTASGIPVYCRHDAIVSISKLKEYPTNAKTHPEKQINLLVKIIKGNGWRLPVTISNQSGFVVRGHGRLAAGRKIGDEVPVEFQDYESEELERADRLADNAVAELAEWDKAMLKYELGELDTGVLADMDITGFDHSAIEALMTAAPPAGGFGGGQADNTSEGSNWNRGMGATKTRVQMGDLDMYIDPELYAELIEHLRDAREETGNDFPFLFEEVLRRGIA